MGIVRKTGIVSLFGTQGQVSVSRGVADFYARRPVIVAGESETLLVLPTEGLDAHRLAEFVEICFPAGPYLFVTSRRALVLGFDATTPIGLRLPAGFDFDLVLSLVTDIGSDCKLDHIAASPAALAAIQLAKLSQGLPAVLVANISGSDSFASEHQIVVIEHKEVRRHRDELIQSLVIASQASAPLNSGLRADFIVFRDMMGGSTVAVIVGKPNFSQPTLVRLHSACLTGDVFGSRRCDCGDQLKLSVKQLEESGGGVILYLAQEGRGVGLANKVRTYQMQDDGLDTVDANLVLGFEDDERDYGIAARILEILGCRRVVLLTNNPAKLEGLAEFGIEITERKSLEAPINSHNRRYLTAKAARAGHQLNRVFLP